MQETTEILEVTFMQMCVIVFKQHWPAGIPAMVAALMIGYLMLPAFLTVLALVLVTALQCELVSHVGGVTSGDINFVSFVLVPFLLGAAVKYWQSLNT